MALRIEDPHGPLDPVRSDSPTNGSRSGNTTVALEQPAAALVEPAPAPAAATKTKTSVSGLPSIDQALATTLRPVNTRVADELWALVARRAEELEVPLRLLITDALVRALDASPSDHADHIKATRRREQVAKIDA